MIDDIIDEISLTIILIFFLFKVIIKTRENKFIKNYIEKLFTWANSIYIILMILS